MVTLFITIHTNKVIYIITNSGNWATTWQRQSEIQYDFCLGA